MKFPVFVTLNVIFHAVFFKRLRPIFIANISSNKIFFGSLCKFGQAETNGRNNIRVSNLQFSVLLRDFFMKIRQISHK